MRAWFGVQLGSNSFKCLTVAHDQLGSAVVASDCRASTFQKWYWQGHMLKRCISRPVI
jgi:hypothetical protein